MVCVPGGPSAHAGCIAASWNRMFTTCHKVYPLNFSYWIASGAAG